MNFYFTSPASVMEARRKMLNRMFDESGDCEPTYSIPMNLRSTDD
jgi:hypothetical protein